MITHQRLLELLIYDPDTGVFTWLRRPGSDRLTNTWNSRYAGAVAGWLREGYRHIRLDGGSYLAHRLAWLWVHGSWPAALIDHINGDRADNRIANLREATQSQNVQNSRKRRNNTSGYKGVTWHEPLRKWRARISVPSKQIFLGYFTCPDEASRAYEAAARTYHGEFANTGRLGDT